ncbi:MAG TPA: ATP-binding protein [Candidatus Sulfotelmatobacter sp.]|jgi:predicted kinase|nr:ATP-binding protein [Candidatus Sulfotelmatobacter sp.]
MRKWMRERLQRRKKKDPEKPSQAAAPPPLQPAYFDAEEAGGSSPEPGSSNNEAPMAEREYEAPAAAEDSASEDSGAQKIGSPSPAKSGASRSGGRRRRGGRGRGGRGREQSVAKAFAPAEGKAAVPEMPGQAPEEGAESGDADVAPPEPQAPAAAPAAPARPPKGIVVLAIGLPGSGKSSWFKRKNVVPLSSDMVRSLLFDDVREQRYQDLVFSNLRSMLKGRLIAKRPMNYVDATNLTPQERQHWIKLAKDYGYEVHAVFFDVPLEVCIERHQRRDRVVPEDIMRRMAAKLKPPTFPEGFAKITVVRVKKKEQ